MSIPFKTLGSNEIKSHGFRKVSLQLYVVIEWHFSGSKRPRALHFPQPQFLMGFGEGWESTHCLTVDVHNRIRSMPGNIEWVLPPAVLAFYLLLGFYKFVILPSRILRPWIPCIIQGWIGRILRRNGNPIWLSLSCEPVFGIFLEVRIKASLFEFLQVLASVLVHA